MFANGIVNVPSGDIGDLSFSRCWKININYGPQDICNALSVPRLLEAQLPYL